LERTPVILSPFAEFPLSPFASLRGNSAKGLARWTHRSFAALRMTTRRSG
jgi:hypothetical protein